MVSKSFAERFKALQPIGEAVTTKRLVSKRRSEPHVFGIVAKNNEAQTRSISISKGLKDLGLHAPLRCARRMKAGHIDADSHRRHHGLQRIPEVKSLEMASITRCCCVSVRASPDGM